LFCGADLHVDLDDFSSLAQFPLEKSAQDWNFRTHDPTTETPRDRIRELPRQEVSCWPTLKIRIPSNTFDFRDTEEGWEH